MLHTLPYLALIGLNTFNTTMHLQAVNQLGNVLIQYAFRFFLFTVTDTENIKKTLFSQCNQTSIHQCSIVIFIVLLFSFFSMLGKFLRFFNVFFQNKENFILLSLQAKTAFKLWCSWSVQLNSTYSTWSPSSRFAIPPIHCAASKQCLLVPSRHLNLPND